MGRVNGLHQPRGVDSECHPKVLVPQIPATGMSRLLATISSAGGFVSPNILSIVPRRMDECNPIRLIDPPRHRMAVDLFRAVGIGEATHPGFRSQRTRI